MRYNERMDITPAVWRYTHDFVRTDEYAGTPVHEDIDCRLMQRLLNVRAVYIVVNDPTEVAAITSNVNAREGKFPFGQPEIVLRWMDGFQATYVQVNPEIRDVLWVDRGNFVVDTHIG